MPPKLQTYIHPSFINKLLGQNTSNIILVAYFFHNSKLFTSHLQRVLQKSSPDIISSTYNPILTHL